MTQIPGDTPAADGADGLSGRSGGGPHEPPRLSFPCDYPIKIMARAEAGVRSHLDAIVERHAGPVDLTRVVERPSAHNNFLGVTYFISAQSPQHIATLFDALKLCPQVLLVL